MPPILNTTTLKLDAVMEYIILFYDTSATGRSLDLEGIDIAKLPDVRSDFNKFRLCLRRYTARKHLRPSRFNVDYAIAPPILISTIISTRNLIIDFFLPT